MIRRKQIITLSAVIFLLFCIIAVIKSLYTRKPLKLTYDAAYYWTTTSYDDGKWFFEELPTGHKYFLYIPEKYREDRDNEQAKLPLIVTFHGSDEKGAAVKYGRFFIDNDFQKKIYPEGAAVLVTMSRINYYTDPASMSLLIQNLLLKNKCIDPSKIVGYGFSQGAKYVVELACKEPRLFKAVVSGSGFYQITIPELISVLPVSFYSAISENDKGIFEQGYKTGKLCGFWCKDSRYVQYKSRWHFYVELKDETGKKLKNENRIETMQDWLIEVVNK